MCVFSRLVETIVSHHYINIAYSSRPYYYTVLMYYRQKAATDPKSAFCTLFRPDKQSVTANDGRLQC